MSAYFNRGNAWGEKNEYGKAIADYNEAIRLDPKYVVAYNSLGYAWNLKKDYNQAITNYNEAIRLDPKNAYAYNSRARLWATCPDAKFRDGKKAVESAKKVMDLDKTKANWYAETLAAAYAESGDFVEAVRWQAKALEDPQLKSDEGARRRLELYKKEQPYRQE